MANRRKSQKKMTQMLLTIILDLFIIILLAFTYGTISYYTPLIQMGALFFDLGFVVATIAAALLITIVNKAITFIFGEHPGQSPIRKKQNL